MTTFKKIMLYIVPFFVYILIAGLYIDYYKFQINGDATAYLDIAKNYASGNLKEAINAYWPPLFSILIVPFLWLNNHALMASKLATLTSGIFVLFSILVFIRSLKIDYIFRLAIIYAAVIPVVWFALGIVTPDLLSTAFSFFYFAFLFDEKYFNDRKYTIFAGLFGGLAYLSKQYFAFFFILHFIIVHTGWLLGKKKLKRSIIIKYLFLGLSVFISIFIIWNGLISLKHGRLIISNPGALNHAWVGPASPGFPLFTQGRLIPPPKSSTSIWTDPTELKFSDWSPLSSKENFKYQIKLIQDNVAKTISILVSYSALSYAMIIIYFIFIWREKIRSSFTHTQLYIFLGIILFILGYTAINVQPRYLWPVMLLTSILMAHILTELRKYGVLSKYRILASALLLLYFFASPSIRSLRALQYTEYNPSIMETIYSTANFLKSKKFPKNAKIASDSTWEEMGIITFLSDGKYYGMTNNSSVQLISRDLVKNKIEYFFVWGSLKDKYGIDDSFLNDYVEITDNALPGLNIYRLK